MPFRQRNRCSEPDEWRQSKERPLDIRHERGIQRGHFPAERPNTQQRARGASSLRKHWLQQRRVLYHDR